jgi:malate permease and related proteins
MQQLATVLVSSAGVFGLLAASWLYARRLRPDLSGTVRVGMHIFVPCLAFQAILDSRLTAAAFASAAAATAIQIGCGVLAGLAALHLTKRRGRNEYILPVAFVNAANLPFPLLLANFGPDGVSIGVVCFTVTNIAIYSLGIVLVHGRGEMRRALSEPALWATAAAGALRLTGLSVPEPLLAPIRLAGAAAVPLMLVVFGDSLARTRLSAVRPAVTMVAARYLGGAMALLLTLPLLKPTGLLRTVLVLYALLPPAMINVVLVRNSGGDDEGVAGAVLLGTLLALLVIPLILALGR